jgi:pyrroloquinoline quinone (PQQ) biosynthesis protein C
VDNLFEEHGRLNVPAVHVETYKRFLRGPGLQPAALESSRPTIPVIAYNRALLDLCAHHPHPEGLGALAVIEEAVARVSPDVRRCAVRRLGVSDGVLSHFADHETLDLVHADEIYRLAAEAACGGAESLVEQGMRLGLYYHRRLYTDLLECVARADR